MRKSRTITLTVLAGLMLTCCIVPCCWSPETDGKWYDENGNVMEEKWKTDANGNKLLDAEGRPIPDPHVPYDRHHRSWVYTGGMWAPLAPPAPTWSSSSTRAGSSGYRSGTTRSFWSGSSSSSSSSSTTTRSSSSSSVSRGGFGTTGSGSSSS